MRKLRKWRKRGKRRPQIYYNVKRGGKANTKNR